MEIINIQAISRQNIPGELNTEKPEGDAFSQILSQIVRMKDGENVNLNTDLIEWIEPIVDQEQDTEDLLFNPVNMPWILMNRDIVGGGLFGQQNMEELTNDTGAKEALLESSLMNPMEISQNIHEGNPLIIESDLDISKEAIEVEGKGSSFEELLGDHPSTSDRSKTTDVGKGDSLEIPMENIEEDSIKFESISIETDLNEKEETLSLDPKDEKRLEENDRVDFHKNPIQSIKSERMHTKELNAELVESRNIDFDHNIETVNDTIVDLMDLRTNGKDNTMKVKLYPEELGYIDVTLKMEEGKLVARILVENEQVRELFNDHIHQLNNKLMEQKISLERVDVDLNLNTNSHSNSNNNQDRGQNPFRSNRGIVLENTATITLNEENINDTNGLNILA